MFTDQLLRWHRSSESTLVYRLTVDDYERLATAGVLDNLRVELIDGVLVRKASSEPTHTRAVDAAYDHLARSLPPDWWIREEEPVRIPWFDVPEPDVSIVRGRRADFLGRYPDCSDVALLVEVADGSLETDRGEKMAAYAAGEVPIYWIINLVDGQVEVYFDPGQGRYRSSRIFEPGELIPLAIDGEETGRIAVSDILPR